MTRKIEEQVKEYGHRRRFHSRWAKVLAVMVCAVVLFTTYAQMLPADALDESAAYGTEEQTPSEDIKTPEPENGTDPVEEIAAGSDAQPGVDGEVQTTEAGSADGNVQTDVTNNVQPDMANNVQPGTDGNVQTAETDGTDGNMQTYAGRAVTESITFSYTNGNAVAGAEAISSEAGKNESYIRFTVMLVDGNDIYFVDFDSNGANARAYKWSGTSTLTYDRDMTVVISGATVNPEMTFDTNRVPMTAATVDQLGISIPGYTYENGYTFFCWSDYWSQNGMEVKSILNYGKIADNCSYNYRSHLGYDVVQYYTDIIHKTGGSDSVGSDYKEAPGYYAYNPTGTLRVVLTRVNQENAYHVNYVDAFEKTSAELFCQDEMVMARDNGGFYYGMIDQTLHTGALYTPTDEQLASHPGYVFERWYKSVDADGNGTGELASADLKTHFTQDVTYYAKWVKDPAYYADLTVSKEVKNKDGDDTPYAFTVLVDSSKSPVAGETEFAYTIYNEDGSVQSTGTATSGQALDVNLSDGQYVTIKDVPKGSTYTVKETSAGNGKFDTTVNGVSGGRATGTTSEQSTTLAFVNTYPAEITLLKYKAGTSGNNMVTLAGAEFYLKDENGKYYSWSDTEGISWAAGVEGATRLITGENGTVVLHLPDGIYYLEEVKAPDGYNLLTDTVTVRITGGEVAQAVLSNESGTDYKDSSTQINIPNSAGETLPETGGTGTAWIYIVGGILVLIAVLCRRKVSRRSI